MYLTAIIDWYSRKIMGWELSDTLDTRPVLAAVKNAVDKYGTPAIINSDQGSQFTSDDYKQLLRKLGIRQSMDGNSRWADNIMIGSKWKLLIMRNLLGRLWRFNELQKSIEGISQKALTEALRSMEADGIVRRTAYPEVPPRVEYSLTELGESMRPIIKSMENWGIAYKAQVQAE